MAESDRPSHSNNRRRTSLRQSRSVDNACIFEMDGLDSEVESASPSSLNSRSFNRTPDQDHERDTVREKDEGDDDDDDDEDNTNEDDDQDNEDDEDDQDDLYDKIDSNSKCTRQFATSLPIQVPLWKTSSLSQETDDDDNKQNITCDEDPMKIAESFRALAWSVKDGTEMFGDLPRRRLNTGDLVKSRPI